MSDRGPPCPTCSSRQTSRCGDTDDGVVYLCSPCCEAFHHEPAQVTPSLVALRIMIVGVFAALALVMWHAMSTRDTSPPRNYRGDVPTLQKTQAPW